MTNQEKIEQYLNKIEDHLNSKLELPDQPAMVAALNLIEIFLTNQNEIANSLRMIRQNGLKTGS